MNIININNDFISGALKAIELFKVVFDVNKNVIITSEEKIHINNTELLLQERNFNNKEFNFGFNFVLKNIEEYRNTLCINPIFYLLLLEQIFLLFLKYDKKQLNNLLKDFEDLRKFLNDYKENSSLKNARPNFEELKIIENHFLKNDFLLNVAKEAYTLKSIEIKEEKFNIIEEDNYYTLKCSKYGKGNIFYNKEVYIWFSKITKKELNNFFDFVILNKKNVVVFYNEADKETQKEIEKISSYSNYLLFIHYPGLNFYDIMKDINILSGKTNKDIYYDNSFGSIFNYIPGKLKELKFEAGKLKIKSFKKYEQYEKYLDYLRNYNHLERFLMMKCDGIIIKCKENILEECRAIVSLSRSIYNSGVFYSEIFGFQLFLYYLKNNFTKNKKYDIIDLLVKSLKEFFLLYNDKNGYNCIINKIKDNDLRLTYNLNDKKMKKEKQFISFEMYDLSFKQLISNIKILASLK